MRAPGRRTTAAVGAVAAAGIALVPLALHQNEHVSRPWADALSASDGLLATSQSFLVGIVWTWIIHRPGVIALGLICAGLLALLWFRGGPDDRRAAALPAGIAAVALVVPLLSSLVGPKYFTPGNELAVWPLLAIVLATGATARRAGHLGLALATAACMLMLAITLASPLDDDLQRDDWRDLIGTLNTTPGARAITVLNDFQDKPVLSYYLARTAQPQPTREITVIGRPDRPATTYFAPPLPQMFGAGIEQRRKIAYARFGAQQPITPPPQSLYQRQP